MTRSVPLIPANIAASLLTTLLYGVLLVLLVVSLYLLLKRHASYRRIEGRPSLMIQILLIASVAFGLATTTHWICNCLRLFQAFVLFEHGSAPEVYFADLSHSTEVVKYGLQMVTVIIADCVMFVWNRELWIMLFPIGTLFGLITCSTGVVYQFVIFAPGQHVPEPNISRWIISDCAFTLATNAYCTALIAGRISQYTSPTSKYGGTCITRAMAIIIESVAIFSLWILLFFAVYMAGSNLQFPIVDGKCYVAGICFALINIRVGLGWVHIGMEGAEIRKDSSIESIRFQIENQSRNTNTLLPAKNGSNVDVMESTDIVASV